MSLHRSFEKLQHIPGILEGHVHAQGCVYAQDKLKKALTSHLWLTLMLFHQEMKAKS